MKKSISADPTSANIGRVMSMLAEMPVKLEQLSNGRSADHLRQPLAPGERSFVETVAHLLNSEARSAEGIYLALLLNEPLLADVHPERQWGKLMGYHPFSLAELLMYFKLRRMLLVSVLSSLSEAQWQRTVREEGKKRKESIYWQARSLALHELEHLSDVERKLETVAPSA